MSDTGAYSNRQSYETVGGLKGAPQPPIDPANVTATDQVSSGSGIVLDIPMGKVTQVVGAATGVREITLQNVGLWPIVIVGSGTDIRQGHRLAPGETLKFLTKSNITVRINEPSFISPASSWGVESPALSNGKLVVIQ